MAVDYREIERRRARRGAIERLSYRCPVGKAISAVLDDVEIESAADVVFAFDLIELQLKQMPEAAATLEILGRLRALVRSENG